jgi:hypothetical protein
LQQKQINWFKQTCCSAAGSQSQQMLAVLTAAAPYKVFV